jgi:hypothetical protein
MGRHKILLAACLAAVTLIVAVFGFNTMATSFPSVSDWNSLKITLQRGPCFGFCPVYKVEIYGDGTVLYDGMRFVNTVGHQSERIPMEEVRRLVQLFRRTDFFSLKDEYRLLHAFDAPNYATSIEFDGKSKTVYDYLGTEVGMPKSVVELEQAIDRTANTRRWILFLWHSPQIPYCPKAGDFWAWPPSPPSRPCAPRS